jgi:hypothetical protein
MEEGRISKNIFTQELEGTRRRGRPRKGWKEEVERDLQVLGVRRWRELVTGKNGKILFDRPKPTVGCKCQWKNNNLFIQSSLSCARCTQNFPNWTKDTFHFLYRSLRTSDRCHSMEKAAKMENQLDPAE